MGKKRHKNRANARQGPASMLPPGSAIIPKSEVGSSPVTLAVTEDFSRSISDRMPIDLEASAGSEKEQHLKTEMDNHEGSVSPPGTASLWVQSTQESAAERLPSATMEPEGRRDSQIVSLSSPSSVSRAGDLGDGFTGASNRMSGNSQKLNTPSNQPNAPAPTRSPVEHQRVRNLSTDSNPIARQGQAPDRLSRNVPTQVKPDNQESKNELDAGIRIESSLNYGEKWIGLSQSVVGHSHLRLRPPVPCQDASLVSTDPRPIAMVSDGAGSSKLSHVGSESIVHGLKRFAQSIEPILKLALDRTDGDANGLVKNVVQMFARHGVGILEDLAQQHVRSIDDFRSTLLLVVLGKEWALWIKVGDGFIFCDAPSGIKSLGPAGKGEFANQTSFLGSGFSLRHHLSFGTVPAKDASGFFLCSDGAGERLASASGERIAGAVQGMLADLGSDTLKREDLHHFLTNRENWATTSGDDKSIAIVCLKNSQL